MNKPKRTTKLSVTRNQLAALEAFSEPGKLLGALSASTVGFAICDKQLRFRAVNGALANMNGVPAEAHLGKTIRNILGDAAALVEPAIDFQLPTSRALRVAAVRAVADLALWLELGLRERRRRVVNCRYDEAAGVATLTEG
jgi:PAS domain-containing protein